MFILQMVKGFYRGCKELVTLFSLQLYYHLEAIVSITFEVFNNMLYLVNETPVVDAGYILLSIQFAIGRHRLPENHFRGHVVFSSSLSVSPPLPNNSTNRWMTIGEWITITPAVKTQWKLLTSIIPSGSWLHVFGGVECVPPWRNFSGPTLRLGSSRYSSAARPGWRCHGRRL